MGDLPVHIVDDEESQRWVLKRALEQEGYRVTASADSGPALRALEGGEPALVLLDVRLGREDGLEVLSGLRAANPAALVVMMTGHGTMDTAIEAMKRGAYDYLVKPLDLDEVSALIRRALGSRGRELRRLEPSPEAEAAIVGKSARLQEIFKAVGRVAVTDATVLIEGESGTGKELVARVIHRHSPRASRPFVTVDCASIPANLLESELFGHERGAFTNAFTRRRGRFELAEGGTAFLDEVGELPLDLQAKLLRVVQERTVHRLGAVEPIEVDVRIIAATNRDLRRAVGEGRFREDLYYRLNVVSLVIPPLRERREDIPLLAEHFLAKHQPRLGRKELSREALDCLVRYDWPGNVRELDNLVQRLLVTAPGAVVHPPDLPPELTGRGRDRSADPALERLLEERLRGLVAGLKGVGPGGLHATLLPLFERPLIRLALRETGGNQVRAARLLGIHRNTLRKRLRALELDGPGRRRPAPPAPASPSGPAAPEPSTPAVPAFPR